MQLKQWEVVKDWTLPEGITTTPENYMDAALEIRRPQFPDIPDKDLRIQDEVLSLATTLWVNNDFPDEEKVNVFIGDIYKGGQLWTKTDRAAYTSAMQAMRGMVNARREATINKLREDRKEDPELNRIIWNMSMAEKDEEFGFVFHQVSFSSTFLGDDIEALNNIKLSFDMGVAQNGQTPED